MKNPKEPTQPEKPATEGNEKADREQADNAFRWGTGPGWGKGKWTKPLTKEAK